MAASVLGALLALLGIVGVVYVRRMMANKKKMMKIAVGDGNTGEQLPDGDQFHPVEVHTRTYLVPYLTPTYVMYPTYLVYPT